MWRHAGGELLVAICGVLGVERWGADTSFIWARLHRSINARWAQKLGLVSPSLFLSSPLSGTAGAYHYGGSSAPREQPFSLITGPDRLLLPPGS
jgi:hypothetical protein